MNEMQLTDKTTQYEYQLGESRTCIFRVTDTGVITIWMIGDDFEFKDMVKLLKEVTKEVKEKGVIPQINIKKSNHYLQCLARHCGYKMLSARKFSFNIWKYMS